METTTRVFLDTSVKKHSLRKRTLLRPRRGSSTYEFYDEDPAADTSGQLRIEIDLLSRVASLARAGKIRLLSNLEATAELLRILLFPSPGESVFAGIEIEKVDSPIEYSRLVTPLPFMDVSVKDLQVAFMDRIDHPRFLQIRRACGAYQGDGVPVPANQIVDAFHVWCAEAGGATHFLTTDFRLTRVVSNFKAAPLKLRVVTPSELLSDLGEAQRSF
jgi:hypothetical protein